MNTYLILNVVVREDGSQTIVVRALSEHKGKGFAVGGNLPELYKGMMIGLELDGHHAVDYELWLTDKNLNILKKYDVDIAAYTEKLEMHGKLKGRRCGWEIAEPDLGKIYDSLPFPQADSIHKEFVDNPVAENRIRYLNKKVLDLARKRRKIEYGIDEYLSYFSEAEQGAAYEQLSVTLKMLTLQISQYGFQNNRVFDNEMKRMEEFVNENIVERIYNGYQLLTRREISQFIDTIKDSGLEQEQLRVLWCLQDSCPCIVTGGAGVGKTSVIQAMIDCYAMHYRKENVLLIAPTGKASRRLAEKTGMPACTIHKALRKSPEDAFVYYNQDRTLPYRVIIVDESSMIDTALMYDLLCAVEPSAKIIFVGDHNQLYPVGYGEPFFDFMSILEVYRLTINHRQDGDTDILKNANAVLEGLPLFSGKGVTIGELTYDDIGEYLTTDKDVQILSPYNELNAAINSYLRLGEDELNVGDKVMTVRNSKDYSNGDIGYITAINENGITISMDGKKIIVPPKSRKDVVLAYSITIHKMQGSECDKLIVFLPKNDRMVDKRMLYTAVTRARKELEVFYYV